MSPSLFKMPLVCLDCRCNAIGDKPSLVLGPGVSCCTSHHPLCVHCLLHKDLCPCSTLERLQPRVVSYEEQVTAIREQLADVLIDEEDYNRAAKTLAGIDLDSGQPTSCLVAPCIDNVLHVLPFCSSHLHRVENKRSLMPLGEGMHSVVSCSQACHESAKSVMRSRTVSHGNVRASKTLMMCLQRCSREMTS